MSTSRYNFNAGPSALPATVRQEIVQGIENFRDTGLGILETSHRSAAFEALLEDTTTLLQTLLNIPASHSVIYATGGATQQFSMVPLNLLQDKSEVGAYIISGNWAKKAYEEAQRLRQAHIAASSEDENFSYIPEHLAVPKHARYLHYTSNNTIYGTQSHQLPVHDNQSESLALICDASSDFCARPIDFQRVALLYAGAQKNVGIAGITVVIGRKELLERKNPEVPRMLQWGTYLQSNSLYNTPPTVSLFALHAMLNWVKHEGGIAAMQERAQTRSARLYNILDTYDCFTPYARKQDRSIHNISFGLSSPAQEAQLLKAATEAGFIGLGGHRNLGGLRISLYNGVAPEAVEALVRFLEEWGQKSG